MAYRILTGEFRNKVKKHFPGLLQQIASCTPHAIIFADRSARPFAWLAKRLWEEFELNEVSTIPQLYFLSTTSRGSSPRSTYLPTKLKKIGVWVKKKGLTGKRVIAFDEYAVQGETLDFLQQSMQSHGVEVIPAAFMMDKPAARSEERREKTLTTPARPAPPPWFSEIPLYRVLDRIHSLPIQLRAKSGEFWTPQTKAESIAYYRQLHQEIDQLAEEMIRERK